MAAVHDRGHLRRGARPTRSSTARPTARTTSPRSRRPRSRSSRSTTRRAPVTSADASGNKDQRDYFVGSATLTLTATDERARRVRRADHRVPHQRRCLDRLHAPVAFNAAGQLHRRLPRHGQGQQHVRGQVDDVPHPRRRGLHAGPLGRVRRRRARLAVAASHAQRRLAGERASRSASGQLHFPTADFELDAANATTSVGPVNFIGQDLAALGTDWQVETEFTVKYTGGWQNTRPDRLERGQQLLPLLDHARPQRRQHLRRAVQGQPVLDRGRALAGRQQHHDRADQDRRDHDPHALHARERVRTPSRRSTASWLRPRSRRRRLRQLRWRRELPEPRPDAGPP